MSASLDVTRFPTIPNYPSGETASLTLSQAFELHDSKLTSPTRQAEITLGYDGAAAFKVSDVAAPNPRASFEVDARGNPALTFFDNGGEGRARFALADEGDPLLRMWSKGEKTNGGMLLDQDGLTLGDHKGKIRTVVHQDGVMLMDERQKVRAVLGSAALEAVRTGATETTGPGSLTLFDNDGRVIWRVPSR